MKLGFNKLIKHDALWVQVLRAKYGMKEQLPSSIYRSQCSHLWRSLSKVWPLLYENLAWLVGNGTSIRCWKDPWIPKIDPLVSFILTSANLKLDYPFKEMVLDDGVWNLDLFRVWLVEDVIQRIISIPPPYPRAGMDRIIWNASTTGSFSIQTAY